MKTAGQILNSARLEQKIELEQVAKDTKIRVEYLAFIESDAYSQLPNSTVAKGFIRNFAEFLHLHPDHILAVFRRDFLEDVRGQIVPRGLAAPVSSRFVWTPRLTLFTLILVVLIFFFTYLIYQYRMLSGPPSLLISEPQNGIVTTEEIITISGKTDPEATVSINDEKIVLFGGGKFSFRWKLSQKGEQTITIMAISKAGRTRSVSRTVIYR